MIDSVASLDRGQGGHRWEYMQKIGGRRPCGRHSYCSPVHALPTVPSATLVQPSSHASRDPFDGQPGFLCKAYTDVDQLIGIDATSATLHRLLVANDFNYTRLRSCYNY